MSSSNTRIVLLCRYPRVVIGFLRRPRLHPFLDGTRPQDQKTNDEVQCNQLLRAADRGALNLERDIVEARRFSTWLSLCITGLKIWGGGYRRSSPLLTAEMIYHQKSPTLSSIVYD